MLTAVIATPADLLSVLSKTWRAPLNTVLSYILFPNPHDGRLAAAMLIGALACPKDPIPCMSR